MKTLFRVEDRSEVNARLAGITAESRRQWGKMTPAQMLAHCADQMRLGLGDLTGKPERSLLRLPPVKKLAIYWMPWPKGRITAPPEFFTTPPTTVEADHAALKAQIERFAGADPEAAWPDHPLFGRMSGRDWGVLAYRHLDHHLRQFGR